MNTPTLIIGAAGSGKTETALRLLREPRQGRALLLVPGGLQQQHIRQRLAGVRRLHVHEFYRLTRLVLRTTHPTLTDPDETTRTMLLRSLLRSLAERGSLPTFAPIAEKPGFIATLGAFIDEARAAALDPQQLKAAGISHYDAELSHIFTAYSAALERLNLADMPRRLLLTCAALQQQPRLLAKFTLLVVDGFDQFTPLQLRLLTTLTHTIERSVITLTASEEQRPAHRRFVRTRAELVAALQPAITTIDTAAPALPPAAERPAVLQHIERHLFNLDAPAPLAGGEVVTLIEAADREREVRAALRHVQGLLHHQGVAPEAVALLFRNESAYEPLLREVAAEYGLPLALYRGLPLIEAPAIIARLMLLRLPLEHFSRRGVVEVWRSFADSRLPLPEPFATAAAPALVALAPNSADAPASAFDYAATLLDRAARHAGIASGLHRLQALLRRLATPPASTGQEHRSPPVISAEAAASLLALLDSFAAWLKPPDRATIGEYAAWVRERTTTPKPAGAYAERWAALLSSLAHAAATVEEPPTGYAAFCNDLQGNLAAARYDQQKPAPGMVAALPVLASRGLHFAHIVLLGMSAGEFPLTLPEPPFYSRRERGLLAQSGVVLPTPDPADERSLFYETTARARRRLVLTRTYLDERGNALQPSPYLQALLHLVSLDQHTIIRAGTAPTHAQAASPQEQLIALMVYGTPDAPAAPGVPALAAHVQRACAVEQGRESTAAYTAFEGVIGDPALQAKLAHLFGAHHRWSVSQINDYITCPFRFAATHVFKLSRHTEPEEGLDSARRGQISHDILARAGAAWEEAHCRFTSEHQEHIIAAMHAAADAVLEHAPTCYSFEPGAFWGWEQADIRRRLERALRSFIEHGSAWAAFRPVLFEQSFGMRGDEQPLELTTPVDTVRIKGRIDRIDQHDTGGLAVLDYKSGSSGHTLQDTLQANDVQLAIYVLAAEQQLRAGQQVARAAFLHLGSGKISPALTEKQREDAMNALVARVGEVVQGSRSGYFAVQPRKKCPPSCAFAHICRLHLAKRDSHATTPDTE